MTGTVMITTGGTGGHVFPGLAVASRLVRKGWRVFWLGTREGMEAKLVREHGVDFESIRFAGVRGKGLPRLLLGPFVLLGALGRSLAIIRRRAPDVVLGLGGFVSFPGALAGVACGKPLVIHDANAVAGLANRILAFGADRILLGFPGALRGRHAGKVEWVGNPVRDEIAALPLPEERFAGRSGRLRLLVLGGSLGAAALNECLPQAMALLPADSRPLLTHQAGQRHLDALRAAYAALGVTAECVAFLDDMAQRYAAADLVVARSGGLTVAELAAAGVGAILIPLPGAIADEQTHNAQFLVDAGAAVLIPQRELSPQRLAEQLSECSRERLLAMAKAARAVARSDAAERVAETCIAEARKARKP
jgi:UDP-N-acetylglucosamine--N-acetylmuramyl-(pentapeptide) pyrophosphoryl-undecaprenol N-acetylglucosamine transferase